MRLYKMTGQWRRRTWLSLTVDIGIAVLLAVVLLRTMFFFELALVPNITALLTGAVLTGTPTGFAVADASVATRIIDMVLSLITATAFMYLAQMYKRPFGSTIALILAACGWIWYLWEVGGISGMLDSEYGLWRELIVFVQHPIAFCMSRYLRGIKIDSSESRV